MTPSEAAELSAAKVRKQTIEECAKALYRLNMGASWSKEESEMLSRCVDAIRSLEGGTQG